MSLQLSIALWGLTALAVPVIIHLLSKRRKSLIHFGSLAFLEKTESPSSKSIQLSQWWLLLLRLAAITTLVVAIAEPFIISKNALEVIYVENSIMSDPAYSTLMDSLSENHNVQCFSIGQMEADATCTHYANMWSFFYNANKDGRTTRIFTHNFSRYYQGTPIMPGPHITVHEVPTSESLPVNDTICVGDSIFQIEYSTEAFLTKTALTKINGYKTNKECTPVRIGISRDTTNTQQNLLKSILQRIDETIPVKLELTGLDEESDWKIILQGTAASLKVGGNQIIWNQNEGPFSFTRLSPTLARMQGTLDRDAILQSHFPLHLTQLLLNTYISEDYDNTVFDRDQLHVDEEISVRKATSMPQPIESFWFIAALILLIAERLLSTKIKRQ